MTRRSAGRWSRIGRQLVAALLVGGPLGGVAGDLSGGVYFSIPLGPGEPYLSLRTRFDTTSRLDALDEPVGQEPRSGAVLDLRSHFSGGQELLLNGTRLSQSRRLYADDASSGQGAESEIDGMTIAAVVVAVGLAAAIANADSIKGCVGTACSSPEEPPAEPAAD